MKTIFNISLAVLLVAGITSCGKFKWDKDEKDDASEYVAVDVRNSNYTIEGVGMNDIESVQVYFFWEYEGKEIEKDEKEKKDGWGCDYGCGKDDYDKTAAYKLVVNYSKDAKSLTSNEKGENLWYEEGTYDVDEALNLTFKPNDSQIVRIGHFENEKNTLFLTSTDSHGETLMEFDLVK